ncbi:acyl-CoA thioesterase [Paenibacillus sp. IITD108]|uniref:acyl-CoA thioesterase n=1 Tax=Paenibacillus sp. IITD108 TaxID=3116649 RepID=UPI002F3F988A
MSLALAAAERNIKNVAALNGCCSVEWDRRIAQFVQYSWIGAALMKKTSFVQPDAEGWLKKFKFSVPIKIRYCETDMLGHVNNVSYFMYFEQGRIEYFENLGLTDALFGEQAVSVVADLECQYLMQLYLKDVMNLHVRAARIGRSSIDIEYAIVVGEALKAAGRGTIVLVDTVTGKSTPIPQFARDIIAAYEGEDINI